MTAQIQVRRDTSANWTSANPILRSGEIGYETNTGNLKIGDGTLAWASLPYAAEQHTYTAYTPTLAQGASSNIAKTVTYAKYTKVGKIVQGNIKVAATAAGTSGSAITLSLPATLPATTSGLIVGQGEYLKTAATATCFRGPVFLASTTTLSIGYAHEAWTSPAAGAFIGVATTTPATAAFAVNSGDTFTVSFQYEAA